MLLPEVEKQFAFRKMRRSGNSNISINSLPGSRPGKTADPTKMAEELFAKVKEIVG